MCDVSGAGQSLTRRLFWLLAPSVVALALFRWSRWAYTHHMKFLAWPMYLLNMYLTGADIPPTSVIGKRCFIGHVRGTIICGELGDDVTLYAAPGMGGGIAKSEPGRPAYGLPVVGHRVTLGARAMVLGAVHIGDDCVVGAGVLVTKDMPPGTSAVSRPPMFVKSAPSEGEAA